MRAIEIDKIAKRYKAKPCANWPAMLMTKRLY